MTTYPKSTFRTILLWLGIIGIIGFFGSMVVRAVAGEAFQEAYIAILTVSVYLTCLGFLPLIARWGYLFIVETVYKMNGGKMLIFGSLYQNREVISRRIPVVFFILYLIGMAMALPAQLAGL